MNGEYSITAMRQASKLIALLAYHFWHRLNQPKNTTDLIPRERLETWLYRLLLKLATPSHKQAIQSYVLIYSPLKLTIFCRLLSHLGNVGYSAHWLSGVLDNLLEGKITTTARPPRLTPMKIKETKASMPVLTQSVELFVAELSTLASMWQPALPFGVLSTKIPRRQDVRKYRIKFTNVSAEVDNVAFFVLAFFNTLMLPTQSSFRTLLLDDETGQKDSQVSTLRKEGSHIVTT